MSGMVSEEEVGRWTESQSKSRQVNGHSPGTGTDMNDRKSMYWGKRKMIPQHSAVRD